MLGEAIFGGVASSIFPPDVARVGRLGSTEGAEQGLMNILRSRIWGVRQMGCPRLVGWRGSGLDDCDRMYRVLEVKLEWSWLRQRCRIRVRVQIHTHLRVYPMDRSIYTN